MVRPCCRAWKDAGGERDPVLWGDHGESVHDGNFCMDGLVYPDRRPHTGLLEYKNVYRPVRAVSFDQETQTLTVRNHMDFTDLQDRIEIRYEVNCDGIRREHGSIPGIQAGPGQTGSARLWISIPSCGRSYLRLYYHLKRAEPLIPEGTLLGYEELFLQTKDNRNQTSASFLGKEEPGADSSIEVEETDTAIWIRGTDFSYCYDKRTGSFTRLVYGGREYLKRPMELNIWRAPTDNDMYIRKEWRRARYDRARARAYQTCIRRTDIFVELSVHLSLSADTVQRMMDVEAVFRIEPSGGIQMGYYVERRPEFPDLPRFGIRLFLSEELEDVTYYGMGPYESYRDKHWASCHGLYEAKVSELHEDYVRPQENGSHTGCDHVTVSNKDYGLTAVSAQPFSFNASVYTQEELEQKKHHYELKPCGSTVLCLDYAQNGIGSNSCGPKVLDRYRFKEHTFFFTMKLVPFAKN